MLQTLFPQGALQKEEGNKVKKAAKKVTNRVANKEVGIRLLMKATIKVASKAIKVDRKVASSVVAIKEHMKVVLRATMSSGRQ